MKVIKSDKKHFCDECDDYGYTWNISTSIDFTEEGDDCLPRMYLCEKCLMKLVKKITER